VVTITYNDPTGLWLTVSSLEPLARAWAPSEWEHLVIDASPDLNRPVLGRLTPGWPLVHVIQAPKGIYEAFNQALVLAHGAYVWFLNGGDGLRRFDTLQALLRMLDADPGLDLVGAGAYLRRAGEPLYPVYPWRSLIANLVGRSWIYHQAMIYRRASLARVGPYATTYRSTGDYELNMRCYIAGLRGRFIGEALVDYDTTGGSSDVSLVFRELKASQQAHRSALPWWVRHANELARPAEHARTRALRWLASTRPGRALRPVWVRLNRGARAARRSGPTNRP
jgi:hypothetical protein